ncbi:M23 family metallopeptidase [Aestuariibacter sp. AA17]|uniref:M23 family metallopeptidase n=1 Tax=Fluctibacter corallii TaxID=2984329 RepID=A0ABT3AC98_9ALTE|nr:M23 family metallopeptidase [Aestuariibacter sp. AA17]MCV2886285.1 M23 family metallopeptidase [Aestuariibacter sp. AA17]
MNVITRVVLSLFVVIASRNTANAYCIEQWACIESSETVDGVQFYVENKRAYPFTASLRVSGENLLDSQKLADNAKGNTFERSVVVEGNTRQLFLSLTKARQHLPFSYHDAFFWAPGDMHATHDDIAYLKPYAKGQYFPIVQGFRGSYSHSGASRYAIDFDMPIGTPIHAARDGVVIDIAEHHNQGGASRRYAKYANYIVILHSDRTTGEYYHLKYNGAAVSLGQSVKAGDMIGYSGNTGFSSLPHLHFAVYRAKPFGKFESLPFRFK